MQELNVLTERVIGCAIEVHRRLGPGLLEGIYERAMCIELELAGLQYERQVVFPVTYRGQVIGEQRIDLAVEGLIIVELKAVERFDPVFEAQILSYLRFTGLRLGLLISFNTRLLHEGVRRFVL